jgi:hypothetical protein
MKDAKLDDKIIALRKMLAASENPEDKELAAAYSAAYIKMHQSRDSNLTDFQAARKEEAKLRKRLLNSAAVSPEAAELAGDYIMTEARIQVDVSRIRAAARNNIALHLGISNDVITKHSELMQKTAAEPVVDIIAPGEARVIRPDPVIKARAIADFTERYNHAENAAYDYFKRLYDLQKAKADREQVIREENNHRIKELRERWGDSTDPHSLSGQFVAGKRAVVDGRIDELVNARVDAYNEILRLTARLSEIKSNNHRIEKIQTSTN